VVHRHPVEVPAEARGEGRAPSPDVDAILDLQRQVGNRAACGLMGLGQPKLEVGPAGDRYEVEADAVARQVVAAIRNADRPPTAGAEGPDPVDMTPLIGRQAEVGAAGGTLNPDTEAAIGAARRSGGAPLDRATATAMEGAFGTDFSRVRLHAGRESGDLNARVQANAFTIGSDIFFRDAIPDTRTSEGQELLAHELTHTIQQGGAAPARRSGRVADRGTLAIEPAWHGSCCGEIQPDGSVIRRHSSWEHSLLGDADPKVLAKMGTWRNLLEQTKREGALVGESNRWFKVNPKKATILGTPAQEEASVALPGIGVIEKAQVMHVLVQEMSRLAKWQTSPPKQASTDKPYSKAEKDDKFDVVVVRLPSETGDSMLITYGELNTLADFYGSLDVMKAADPKQRTQIVQSVRKETFLRLKEIYDYLNASLTKTERESQEDDLAKLQNLYKENKLDKTSFQGAATPDFISSWKGQADLLAGDKPLIGQGTGAGGGTNAYAATLARNACHFVPESWHAWADYHEKARVKARDSRAALRKANRMKADMAQEDFSRRPLDEYQAKADLALVEREVTEAANDALLANGFGDHYLQDSYASGHMINKTQIMQWYVEFIDKNDEWDYMKDENWRRMQQMAYGQPGLASQDQYKKSKVKGFNPADKNPNLPRNPQSVENMEGDWQVRFAALGLAVPPSLQTPGSAERQLIEWWQKWAGADSAMRTQTGAQLLASAPGKKLGQKAVEDAMLSLVADGIARTEADVQQRGEYMQSRLQGKQWTSFATTTLVLRSDYVPRDMQKFRAALAQSQGQADDSAYQKMAQAVTYSDFQQFLNSGFIQKSTNALHDVFCKGGLDVQSKKGGTVFRVYGDDAMFSANSSKGVRESGITSNMSRDAILSIINKGNDGGITTESILDRLPNRVQIDLPNGKTVKTPLETWHNSDKPGYLKDQCMKEIFPDMSWEPMQKFVPGVAGSDLAAAISKDANVHGSDAF
jgi:hypothetical protein